MINYLDPVALTRDIPQHRLRRGDVGSVVFEHEPGTYEVEFVTGGGTTMALLTLAEDALRPLAASDLLHVRDLEGV